MLKNIKILVADDEQGIRDFIAYELNFQGAEVFEAEDSREAIELLEKHPIDFILSDVHMPKGDGLKILQHLKKSNRKIPIAFMTGFGEVTREDLLFFGATEVFSKPLDQDLIVRVIAEKVRNI